MTPTPADLELQSEHVTHPEPRERWRWRRAGGTWSRWYATRVAALSGAARMGVARKRKGEVE